MTETWVVGKKIFWCLWLESWFVPLNLLISCWLRKVIDRGSFLASFNAQYSIVYRNDGKKKQLKVTVIYEWFSCGAMNLYLRERWFETNPDKYLYVFFFNILRHQLPITINKTIELLCTKCHIKNKVLPTPPPLHTEPKT